LYTSRLGKVNRISQDLLEGQKVNKLVAIKNMQIINAVIIALVLLVTAACKSAGTSTTLPQSTTTASISTFTTSLSATTTVLSNTVSTSTKTGIGTYLVDGKGITLYWTTLDSVGQSNVNGSSLSVWPVFYVSNITVSPSLNTSDFGSITRADGKSQISYKGWPLYYYYEDQASGSTLGQGVDGVWFAVNPAASGPTATTTTTTTTPSGY
jgi:predicted lipoprotein with Yx(FWY)xxD motif